MSERHATLGGLSCTVVQAKEGPPTAAVILAHGFGAPGDDLVGLHGALIQLCPALAQVRFVFPAAPLSMGHGMEGRAWWMIDFATIEKLNRGDLNALREFRKVEPAGMPAARAAMLKLVDDVAVQSKLPVGKLVLGGFSQGAMITTDVALRLPEAPLALVAMSGTLLLEEVWAKKAAARAGLPVFQSHGTHDMVLRYDAAELLTQLLTQGGLKVDFTRFEGGHEIPLVVLKNLANFLEKRLATLR